MFNYVIFVISFMPELPEVQTVVSELNRKLHGKIIARVKVNAPKMISVGPATVSNIRKTDYHSANQFIRLLQGKKIKSVKRRAKLLIFELSGALSILVHLKMTGQFIYEDAQLQKKTKGKYRLFNKLTAPLIKLPSKHTHVIFYFTDGSVLYFNDIRKFGYMRVVLGGEIGQVKELREFGPEPLDKKFSFGIFVAAVARRPKVKIKQVLMDAKVVAGIGNIYSDEILFHAGIWPTVIVSRISDKGLRKIYKYIRIVLTQAIKAKGSSVGDFVRTDGSWGQMGKFHFVYGRKGQKCKKCGTIIASIKLNGRTASFCPKCQK